MGAILCDGLNRQLVLTHGGLLNYGNSLQGGGCLGALDDPTGGTYRGDGRNRLYFDWGWGTNTNSGFSGGNSSQVLEWGMSKAQSVVWHRVQAIRSAEALGVWGTANSEMFSEQHRGDFHEAVPNPGASPQPVTLPLPFLTWHVWSCDFKQLSKLKKAESQIRPSHFWEIF